MLIIDRDNYPAHRPRPGDELRHSKTGAVIARVVRIRRKGTLLVESATSPHFEYELLNGIHWEAALESGIKLHRPGGSAEAPVSSPKRPARAPEEEPMSDEQSENQNEQQEVLERTYKGRTVRVTKTDDGYEWEGTTYRSLSAVARAICGYQVSGPAFFKLKP